MTRIPRKGEYITIKDVSNPYVSTNAKMLVLSTANPIRGEDTIVNVFYHGKPYHAHISNIKKIFPSKEKEKVDFT